MMPHHTVSSWPCCHNCVAGSSCNPLWLQGQQSCAHKRNKRKQESAGIHFQDSIECGFKFQSKVYGKLPSTCLSFSAEERKKGGLTYQATFQKVAYLWHHMSQHEMQVQVLKGTGLGLSHRCT